MNVCCRRGIGSGCWWTSGVSGSSVHAWIGAILSSWRVRTWPPTKPTTMQDSPPFTAQVTHFPFSVFNFCHLCLFVIILFSEKVNTGTAFVSTVVGVCWIGQQDGENSWRGWLQLCISVENSVFAYLKNTGINLFRMTWLLKLRLLWTVSVELSSKT